MQEQRNFFSTHTKQTNNEEIFVEFDTKRIGLESLTAPLMRLILLIKKKLFDRTNLYKNMTMHLTTRVESI